MKFTGWGMAIILCLAVSGLLSAQTAAELDAVLAAPVITNAQAAKFVLNSVGVPDSGGGEATAAFEQALAKGWFSAKAGPNDPVRMGTLSFLMTRAFNIRGGFMYALLPGPRYALRAMVSRSLIQGAADPAMIVSGERFLQILGNVLTCVGEDA
jgi:hypothetical protein